MAGRPERAPSRPAGSPCCGSRAADKSAGQVLGSRGGVATDDIGRLRAVAEAATLTVDEWLARCSATRRNSTPGISPQATSRDRAQRAEVAAASAGGCGGAQHPSVARSDAGLGQIYGARPDRLREAALAAALRCRRRGAFARSRPHRSAAPRVVALSASFVVERLVAGRYLAVWSGTSGPTPPGLDLVGEPCQRRGRNAMRGVAAGEKRLFRPADMFSQNESIWLGG